MGIVSGNWFSVLIFLIIWTAVAYTSRAVSVEAQVWVLECARSKYLQMSGTLRREGEGAVITSYFLVEGGAETSCTLYSQEPITAKITMDLAGWNRCPRTQRFDGQCLAVGVNWVMRKWTEYLAVKRLRHEYMLSTHEILPLQLSICFLIAPEPKLSI